MSEDYTQEERDTAKRLNIHPYHLKCSRQFTGRDPEVRNIDDIVLPIREEPPIEANDADEALSNAIAMELRPTIWLFDPKSDTIKLDSNRVERALKTAVLMALAHARNQSPRT